MQRNYISASQRCKLQHFAVQICISTYRRCKIASRTPTAVSLPFPTHFAFLLLLNRTTNVAWRRSRRRRRWRQRRGPLLSLVPAIATRRPWRGSHMSIRSMCRMSRSSGGSATSSRRRRRRRKRMRTRPPLNNDPRRVWFVGLGWLRGGGRWVRWPGQGRVMRAVQELRRGVVSSSNCSSVN